MISGMIRKGRICVNPRRGMKLSLDWLSHYFNHVSLLFVIIHVNILLNLRLDCVEMARRILWQG